MDGSTTSNPRTDPESDAGNVRRVAMIIQRFRPAFTGQGVQLEQLCQHLAARGVTCEVLTAVRGQPSEHERCTGYSIRRLRADLLPGSRRNSHVWMPTFAARTGLALLRPGSAFDVVHVHGLTDALYAAWAATRLRRTPLVFEMTLLGDDDPVALAANRKRLQRAREAIYARCDAYVAMSRAFLDSWSRSGLPSSRLQVIPQGVDTERFRPADEDERAALRRQLGLPSSGELLAFVGSLVPRKGIDLLLSAFATLHDTHPESSLALVGATAAAGTPERSAYDDALAGLGTEARQRVFGLGRRDDPEIVMRAADLFVFPSRREGFGSVIIEAMASGLPVVAADLPGITDMIFAAPLRANAAVPREPDGAVVEQDDPEALATRLRALVGSPELRARLGDAARQRAVTEYGFPEIADRYLRLYEGLAAHRGPR